MSHKVHCWCGMNVNPKRLHYPANNPENGPAHKPTPPCKGCGNAPHSDHCFPTCICDNPHPFTYLNDENPIDSITICRSCANEIAFPSDDTIDHIAAVEPVTYGPMGLQSEHITLHMLRSNGHSNIGSALAVALSRWISEDHSS